MTEGATSLLSDKKEELLLIGAGHGLEFLVYDLRSNQVVNKVYGHRRETPTEVLWITEQSKALSSSKMTETIGWNAVDWSPLFAITKDACVPFVRDRFHFGGLVHENSIKFWGPYLDQELLENCKVDAEISDAAMLNCSNEAFLEKSISANNHNQIQSDRLSKEEDQVSKISKPIQYELIKDGSIDLTLKDEAVDQQFEAQ